MRFFSELRAAGDFLAGVGSFLRHGPDAAQARGLLDRQVAERERHFVSLLRDAIFAHTGSPYRQLLDLAGIGFDDVVGMLGALGLEATLGRLHDAGVYVTLEEFKGHSPIRRPGLELAVRAEDFDNPRIARRYAVRTGGSGGRPRNILIGLDLLAHESAYHALFYDAHEVTRSPLAMWLPAPPGAVGIKNALMRARLGQPVDRWYSQTRFRDAPPRHVAFGTATLVAASMTGVSLPAPEYTPAPEAGRVARWLEAQPRRRRSAPSPLLLTTPSGAVRTCMAAIEEGLDIAGSRFVLVGEPFTGPKAAIIARAGCTASSHYAMVEAGMIGLACSAPNAIDDVHLVIDKVATIQRERSIDGNGARVGALLHTTLLPSAPKVMLNVESGDFGVLEERDCGCGILPGAFRRHLHTIHSYEKLTSEGMHFLGVDLVHLVEEVLPARFGGHPTDYQLIEREQDGLSSVTLRVHPSIGPLNSRDVVDTALAFLRRQGVGQRLMTGVWAGAGTLRLERTAPHVTPAGKILPLQKVLGR